MMDDVIGQDNAALPGPMEAHEAEEAVPRPHALPTLPACIRRPDNTAADHASAWSRHVHSQAAAGGAAAVARLLECLAARLFYLVTISQHGIGPSKHGYALERSAASLLAVVPQKPHVLRAGGSRFSRVLHTSPQIFACLASSYLVRTFTCRNAI